MDRQIVYPGQILPETTLLQIAKDAMIGSAKLAAAMLGTSTIANGFAVTPTGPASMQVVVAPGEIYSLSNIDSLAYSTLPADTTHSIMKQGIMLDGIMLSCPAPTTTGQSINYLVQVTYQDQDLTPVLLPYYNSANPALPYSGVGNNGLTQNTARKGVAVVQVKAGASAATGSQVTPAPDSGYVGLYVATVAFGQTAINSGNITQYSGAPLLPSGVLQSIQSGNTTYALDIGTANSCAATFFPSITNLQDGLTLRFKAANANTGATTFSPNGIAAAPVVGGNHAALQGGEIVASSDVWVQWNSTIGSGSWVLIKSSGGGLQVAAATKAMHAPSAGQIQLQALTAFTTGGVSTALTLTPVPAITAYAPAQRFNVTFSVASGLNPTINISGRGPVGLKQYDASGAKVSAVFSAGQTSDIVSDGTDFVLLNTLPTVSASSHGQCKLAKVGANIVLSPLNGNKLLIAGVSQSIPGAGVSLAPTGLTPGSLYYTYAFMSAGVMTLEASTTGHSTDAATGVEIKTGDASRTLVGMTRPITGPAFQDSAAQRFVLSYFNRVDVTASVPYTANVSTSSATYVELSAAFRCEYLSWGNEPVRLVFNGNLTPSAGISSLQYLALADTGTTPRDGALICSTVNPGVSIPGTLIDTMSASEGYHYTTIVGKTTAGQTVTCLGAASAPDRCVLMTTTRG